jgi:tetratricopeptide (TPR) repeat protein
MLVQPTRPPSLVQRLSRLALCPLALAAAVLGVAPAAVPAAHAQAPAPSASPSAVVSQAPPAEPAAVVPPELSDQARRAYAQGLKEARELIARKDYAAAAARLDALLAERGGEPQARFLLGTVQVSRGDAAAAIAIYRALTEDYPELPEPWNNLAVLYADRGDYNGALLALETAVAAAPDWPVAHENLGDLHARIAAVQYERAATLDRTNKTAPAKLALARQLLSARPPSP